MPENQTGRLVPVRAGQSAAAPQVLGSEPGVGQIRGVRPERGQDMHVLVVEVHEHHVQAMLCGEECELATETDAVLEPHVTGLSRRILVHGDVSGSILTRRLGRVLGQVKPDLAERIALRGRGLDFIATDLGRGTSIADESDPRWEWKLKQHRQLRRVRARASELGWGIYRLGPREE